MKKSNWKVLGNRCYMIPILKTWRMPLLLLQLLLERLFWVEGFAKMFTINSLLSNAPACRNDEHE